MTSPRRLPARGALHELVNGDDAQVGKYSQTNVRIPDCAWEALEVIRGDRGLSRDETVRQLLAEYVAQQEAREPAERLTHISTLLRHPQQQLLKSDPPVGRLLRLGSLRNCWPGLGLCRVCDIDRIKRCPSAIET